MSIQTIGSHTIGYTDIGQGPPLVLIHGHPFNRSMWDAQTQALAARYRIIAPDLRGYGESSVTPGNVTLGDHARDIADLLDALQIQRAPIGGLSMGGQIVLEFYWSYPERVSALLLADTFAQLDAPEQRQARFTMADRLEREGMSGYAQEVLPKMIAPTTIQDQPQVAAHVLRMMRETQPAGAAASLRGRAERRDFTPLLQQIAVPTCIVVGEDDVFTPVSNAQLMRQAIPRSQMHIIPRSGHMPNLEQPEQFNALLCDWLDTLG